MKSWSVTLSPSPKSGKLSPNSLTSAAFYVQQQVLQVALTNPVALPDFVTSSSVPSTLSAPKKVLNKRLHHQPRASGDNVSFTKELNTLHVSGWTSSA
ncbi:phosphoribosylamine--glycine ligase [Sesbania bispinosa]|nr:phosphoribosylamine--glycine ligase [Sesbania bispinosa]